MANLNKCGGYIYEGKEYTAKELFDKLNGGEIDALIAQGVVTLTQEQAPTLVKAFLKYNPINTGVKPTNEVTLETALAEYPIGSEVVVINPVTGEEKETVVSDIKEDNGFAPFVEVEDSNVPVPIANVAKKRKSRKDRDLGTIGREMLLPEDLSIEGFEFEEDDFSYHPVLEEDEDVAVTPSWIMKDENGNMYVTADSIKDNFERLYDELKKYDQGTFNIVDLRQLYVNAFQRLMKYKNGANVQLELMMELEDAIDAFNSPLDTLSKEEVIELINKNKDYTKEQKAIFVDFVNSIKSNSLFKFDPKGQASENYYAFTENVLKAKSPNAFFHEIGHWGFYNVLSKEDRKKFYQYCIDKFYGTGVSLGESLALSKPILNEDKTMSFNYGNATDNFSEYFAEQFNQYILGKQTDKQLETIFQKLVGFVKNIIASLRKHGYDENLKELFDKIADVNNIAKPVKEVINDTIEGKPVKKVKEKKTPKLTEARKNKITTAVNSATAGVVNAASDEQLKANGWDKESLIKFQKSINDAFNNPNLGANMYGATIQVVALTSAQMYEYIKSAHPESVKGLNPEEVIIKGTLLKGNTVLLNIEKATPTTPLHEVAGHLWEKWAKLNAPLLYNSAMSKVNQMPLYELVSKADYSKGTAFEIANQLEKDPLFKKAGVSKEFLTELVQYALIKKEGGKAEINRTLRSEIFAKVIETNAEALAKGKDKTTYQFFKDLLEKLYEAIRNTLRFSSITTAELNTITVDQFSQKVIAEILSARLSTATRNKSEEELETGGKKKKQVVESLGADENEYESVQSTFGDSSMDDLTEQNEQEKKEEKALEGGLETEAEVPVIEEEKPKSKEEKAIISSIKLDASKLFVQVVDIANDTIESFTKAIDEAKKSIDNLLDKMSPTMELSEREKYQDRLLTAEKALRKLESKQKLSDIISNIKNIVTDSGILKSYLEDANVPENEKSFQAYLHKLLAGNISLTEEQRKVLGTAQRGPLSDLYKYHADAVSNQEKIDEINAEIKAIIEDSKIVKKEKAVKWADVPKEVKSKFKSQAEYKKYLENKANELENRRVDLKEELTNLQAEKITPQNIFDAVIANEKKIAKDLKIGQERSQRTSEERFQKKLEDTSNDIFAELENIDKSIKQLNKQLKEIDENLSLEELPQSERNKLDAAKAKLTSDKNKLVAKKNDIVNKFAQLSIGINKISPDSYKVFLESDNGQMMQLMPGAFFPNKPYLHFVGTNTDGQGTFNSTYNYKSENGANLATITVSLNTTDGFGSVNFVAKDKLNGNTVSAKKAFIAATKLIQSFGLSPKVSNYINGYGFELMEKLVEDGILVRNNLVDRLDPNANKIKQQYYLLQPFQYNDGSLLGSEDEVQFSISLNPNANPKQQPALTPNQINAIQAIANQYQNIGQFQSPNFQPYQAQNRSWVSRMFSRFMYSFGGSKVISEDYMVAKEQNISGYQAKMRSEMKKDRDNLISLALTSDFKSEPLFKNCSTEGIIELINMALGGDMMIMNALPTELQSKAKSLRNKIDAITEDVLRSGYTNATTAQVMEENKGKYLTRSFYKYIMKPTKWQNLKKSIFGTTTAWDKYVDNLKKAKPEVIDRALSGFFVFAIDGKISERSKTNDPNFKTIAQRWNMVSNNFTTIDAMRKKLATITSQLETEKDATKRKVLLAEKETVSNDLIAEAEAQTDADVMKLVDDTKKFAEMALDDLMSQEDPSKHKVDLGGYLPGQVQNVNLTRRKEEDEFPEWMRDAIGEIQDPTINYAQTVNNLTKLNSRIKFLNQIYKLGKKDGFVIRAADIEYDAAKKEDLKKEGWVLINGTNQENPNKLDNSPQSVYGPFIGTYIHPDLHRFAFGVEAEISSIYMLRGLVLAGKTIGNIIFGPERNLAGNLGMLLMNGTFTKMATNFYYDGSIKQETDYIKTLKGNNFANKYVTYWSDIVADAERLGVISNVHSGAVVEIFKQMSKDPTLMKAFEDDAATGWTSLYKKILTAPSQFAKFNTAAYIWADIIPKIYAYNVERNSLAADYSTFENKTSGVGAKKLTYGSLVTLRDQAIANKDIAEVERLTRVINNLNEIAASFTNQTMVSHERVMPLVENLNKTSLKKSPGKAIAKFIFGGDFVRFKAETTRIFLQTFSSVLGGKKQFTSKDNKGVVDLFDSKAANDKFAKNINTKQRVHSLGGFLVWSNAYAQVVALYIAFGKSLLNMIGIGGDDDDDEYIETDPSKSYKTLKQSASGSGMFDKNSNFGTELQRIYMGSANGGMSVDEAVREYSNDYMNLHQLGFNLQGDGKFEVKDKGTIDPFASTMALLRGFTYSPQRGWTNKLNGYVSSIYSEEAGTEMMVNVALNILKNEDQYGKKIYNEKENIESQILDGSIFVGKGLAPAVLSTYLRVKKAVEGIFDDKGNVIKQPVGLGEQLVQENINAFTGRSYYVDVKQKLATFIREEAGDSEQGLNAQIYGAKSEQGLKTIVYELNRKVEAARVLGVSENDIVNIISRSVLGRKPQIANAVYQGGSYIDNLTIENK
jgi:hypothetical protein